jgi:glycosyltransferase involved in cell wall biosynthesis
LAYQEPDLARPHLHLHLPGFDVGGTEQWVHAMVKGLSALPWRLSATQGVAIDATAEGLLRPWERLEIGQIPPQALVIAPSEIDSLTRQSRRVIAVAHGMNHYYKEILAGGGYLKGVAVADVARAAFPPGVDITTIHNGVDLERLAPVRDRRSVRAALNIPPSAIVIGFVGRWSIGKNPLAIAKAAAAIPGAVALYVGPHDQSPSMVAQARAMADCRLVAPEQAPHIGDFYASMDVVVIASRSEGFSLVMAEAWHLGAPVVATAVGIALDHPELVVPLPPDPDQPTLAAAVIAALSPDRAPIIAEAQRTVAARYTTAHMGQRWRDYLRDLVLELDGPSGPA